MEDQRYHSGKTPKSAKSLSRSSKRTSPSHEHGCVLVNGRQKRVWKACERCRMKKTKCDGESPCKRCKDDGLVCIAGSRRTTEFKQIPRGYAEVLENTQYALIATIQRLYTMIRNNESWELGEPEMNDRGQPVIHDVASKLGCIRPSPDLPYAFPEGAEDFTELQEQLQQARSEMGSEDMGTRTKDGLSDSSPAVDRTDPPSSSESDHSSSSKDYSQMLYAQQRLSATSKNLHVVNTVTLKPATLSIARQPTTLSSFDVETYSSRTSFDTNNTSIPSPIYTDFQNDFQTDFQTDFPMFRNDSPFSPWSAGGDDFLSQAHALDVTAHYVEQQQYGGIRGPSPLSSEGLGIDADVFKAMQLNDELNFAGGTIRLGMLDCNTGYDLSDPVDTIMYGRDYEAQVRMA